MSEDILIIPKKRFHIEEALLTLLLILSLVGIGITDFSPADGYGYWIIMVFVFALFAIIIGWRQSKHHSGDFKKILREQSIHWSTSLLVVGGAFLIQKSGRIESDDIGLVILLILSLSTILDGLRVGWRFSLVGLFLGASAVIAVYTEHFLWIELLIALLIVLATIVWEIWQAKKA
jgi:cobalamin synthase